MHLFYQPLASVFALDEEESRHLTKVLRLRTGDSIHVTDGKGLLQTCRITELGKNVKYVVTESSHIPQRTRKVIMAVAPTRKAERNEWMVEKMTEIGVDQIDFIVTEHTHTEGINRVVNLTRLNRIAVAAMKQSQQYHLPLISVGQKLGHYLADHNVMYNKLLAYVPEHDTSPHVFKLVEKEKDTVLLIGPEGDFTPEEVALAISTGYKTVSLGLTRLRTETAAVAGCHAINLARNL